MSRHAQVYTERTKLRKSGVWLRQILWPVSLFACTVVGAAQPLSDHELKHQYLSYDADANEVIVVVRQNPASQLERDSPLQLLSRTLRLIDRENTDNLLFWQERQGLAVGANLGLQDTGRQVLAAQPIAQFGSESFSLRWGGNLDQVVEISRISGFALYGVDVELYNISGTVRIEARTF